MSRTHLLPSSGNTMSAYSSTSHEMTTAVERAMQTGGVVDEHGNLVTKFTFSLIDLVREIKTERLKADALSRLQFSIDGFISGALSRMLNQFYQFSKTEASLTNWASYGDFLRHIEGIEHTEQALYEAGCDVSDTVARIRNLVTFRSELHYVSASQLSDPSTYDAPRLVDVLSKPRMRNLSAAAELGLQAIVEDDTDDKELQAELLAQYKLDDRLERMNQHRMDMMRAKSLVVLFSCLPIDEDAPVDDETDAFFRMDAHTQYSLLGATLRAVTETRRKAVTDNRLPIMEKGALRVEAKALMATLTTALEHWSFADIAS